MKVPKYSQTSVHSVAGISTIVVMLWAASASASPSSLGTAFSYGPLKRAHLKDQVRGILAILGNGSEFRKSVLWLGDNLTFDVDVRVNLFECNIRLLGGLVSGHLLATGPLRKEMGREYKGQLLNLANDLGKRLLKAFNTPTGIPYAWINLKHGVMENETTETSTSGCGSLILEMGALSRLTGNVVYERAALGALRKLWSMRSSLDLPGTTLDVLSGKWIERSSGIGAGVDSFYEYLLKAYILFGRSEYWDMFHSAYVAVQKHFRYGPWYHEADMRTGTATYWQLTSLQAFWPGLQVLVGDVSAASSTYREFFTVWKRYGVLPERYLLDRDMLHPTEKYYPLRPELVESTFYLYQATKDPWYLEVAEAIINSLNVYTRVEGGFASVKDVTTMELEDHQHSFLLSETCKYLYLLFDDSFLKKGNYLFTTEGHLLPLDMSWHHLVPSIYKENSVYQREKGTNRRFQSAMSSKLCPATSMMAGQDKHQLESACHELDKRPDHRCHIDNECGVDTMTCRRRTCSIAGYCGLWSVQNF